MIPTRQLICFCVKSNFTCLYDTPILPLGFSTLEIVDNLIQQSVVDFGCAEDRAASEGDVEGGKDDGGEYCKGSITVS